MKHLRGLAHALFVFALLVALILTMQWWGRWGMTHSVTARLWIVWRQSNSDANSASRSTTQGDNKDGNSHGFWRLLPLAFG